MRSLLRGPRPLLRREEGAPVCPAPTGGISPGLHDLGQISLSLPLDTISLLF